MSTLGNRIRRRIARTIAAAPPPRAKITLHVGEVVSVGTGTAAIYLNGNTTESVDPVPVTPGLVLTAGQIVEVTFLGPAPTITRRIT